MFPLYLRGKLKSLGINSLSQLIDQGYLKTFHYLKLAYPSSSFKILFDLYSLCFNLEIGGLTLAQKNNLKHEYKMMPPCHLPLPQAQIDHFMYLAQEEAILAKHNHEIPIGAIVVKDGSVIATGHNQTYKNQKITQHAEIIALENAANIIGSHRLDGCDLYVTIEPCLMCSGAIIHSRIQRLIFGATERKTGAISSQYNVFSNLSVNHHTQVIGPINQELHIAILQDFFNSKR